MQVDLHGLRKGNSTLAYRSRWFAEKKTFFFSCRIEAEQVRTNGYYTSDIKLYLVTECLVQCRVSDGEVQAGREACTHPQIRHKSPFRL